MKNRIIFSAWVFLSLSSSAYATDWKQPSVGCIEDFAARGVPCLDLSTVSNPQTEWPAGLSAEEKTKWQNEWRFDLSVCRAREVLKREKEKPGSFSASTVYLSYMKTGAGNQTALKIRAIYNETEALNMPPQILFGALSQESLLSDIGIEPDGNNYSCGIAQLNIQEWCRSMNMLSEGEQALLGWPAGVTCNEATIPTTIVAPFYEWAQKKLNGRASYELIGDDYKDIALNDVIGKFPIGNASLQEKRFLATKSFVMNCQNPSLAIQAKARELNHLYQTYVPESLRLQEHYGDGETFSRTCDGRAYTATTYPLQTAWLLAVGMYNAGAKVTKIIQHYYSYSREAVENGSAWVGLKPTNLVEAFHWGGKYNSADERVYFTDAFGSEDSQAWFKSCVLQRHIARVAQYSTIPGQTTLVSLEQEPCKRGPAPAYRQNSSGKK